MHTAGHPYLGLAHGVGVKAGNGPRRLLHPGLSADLCLSWQVQGDMVLWDYVDEQCGHNLERKRRQSWWKEEKLISFLLGPLVFLNPERQTTSFWWAIGKAEKKKRRPTNHHYHHQQRDSFLSVGQAESRFLLFCLCDLCIMYSMWELDHKEGWALKNWCFQTLVLEKPLESPLHSRDSKPVSPKGNQPWIHWKDWCWSSKTLATWYKEPTHWKRPWCTERLRSGKEGDREWDGWIASLT